MGIRELNMAFGVHRRKIKGRTQPPPPAVAEVLLARAERMQRRLTGSVRRPDPEPGEGWNRALKRANGDRGDRRHGNHPWNTRHVPRGKR